MEAKEFKCLLEKYENTRERHQFLKNCRIGEQYFRNENDIKRKPASGRNDNPLKTSDNRVSHYWHGLLVMQKISYLFGKEPAIDTKEADVNEEIARTLGDEWAKTLNELVKDAANKAVGWLHVWIEDGSFQYGSVSPEEIIPIYSQDLKKRLTAVIRKYKETDSSGNGYIKYEYWDNKECTYFKCIGSIVTELNCIDAEQTDISKCSFKHTFGQVPFVYFNNNSIGKGDLYMYKDLIDQFDAKTSGFANDIDDVQEIIFVLEGYGGEDLEEFMSDLKTFKAVKTDDKGDVRTIKAEIPVEARKAFLDDVKKAIFLFGMGVNPDKESFGDSSGVALKFLYSLLELKAATTRTEFDCSIKVLVRMILHYLGKEKGQDISITYYKNMISNDKEVVEILSKSDGIISVKTQTKNHPYTEKLDDEVKQLKAETLDNEDYNFGKTVEGNE